MSNVVEDRIINLKFNNKDFEKNAAQSMRTIDALEEKLTFKDVATKGIDAFTGIINAAKKIPSTLEDIADAGTLGLISKIKSTFSRNGDMFSPLLEMATGAFRKIGDEAYGLGKQIATSLTTDQVSAGWQKYANKTASVQTIMNATGKSIGVVTEALSKLNWYSDETSYSYTDMTSNIAKFTSSGVDLDTAVTAMIGIGNAAGLAGASVQNASHAMEGFAKAIGQGYMDRQKWSWIESAQMDTQQFKKSLIEAAVALGELHSNGDGTYYSNNGKELTSLNAFENDMASGKWMTKEVMLRALQDYGALTNKVYDVYQSYGGEKTTSEILDEMGVSAENLGLKALKAAQEAKTFSDAIDSVKDAVSTGWMETFDIVFGNYVEAKSLWTDFANWLYAMFADSGTYRNEQFDIFMGRKAADEDLDEYYTIGEQMLSGREYFLQALYKFMEVISAYAEAVKIAWDRTFGAWDYNTIGEIATNIHRVAEILGATLQKDLAMDPKEVSEWEWLDNNNRNSFITLFRLAMERFFNIFKETINTIKFMGSTLYEALYDAFGSNEDRSHGFYISGFYKWFTDLTSRVAKFIKTFRQVLIDSDRFKRILNGNFAVLKIFFNILGNFVDYLIQNGGGVIAIVAELLASIGDFAVSLDQSNLYEFINGLFPIISTISSKILSAILSILNVIGKGKDFFLDFFNIIDDKLGESGALDKLTSGFKNLTESLSALFGLGNLGDFIDGLTFGGDDASFLDAVVDGVTTAVALIGGFFDLMASGIDQLKAFGDTIASVAGNIGGEIDKILNKIFGDKASSAGGLTGTEEKESIFTLVRKQVSDMLSGLFKDVDNEEVTRGATEYSGSVIQGVINGFRNAMQALNDVGIDWDKVKFLSIFVGFVVTIVNMNNQIATVTGAIDDVAGSISSVPEAIASTIESFGEVFGSIGEFMDEVKDSLSELVEVEKIQMIADVISTLAMIVMLLATIPEQDLAKGVTYLGIITGIFVAFQKAMGAATALVHADIGTKVVKSFMSGNKIAFNSGLLGAAALVVALASLVTNVINAIKTISDSSIEPSDIVAGVSLVVGIMVAMGIFIAVISRTGKGFITTLKNESLQEVTTAKGRTTGSLSENTMTGPSGKLFYGVAAAILGLSFGIKIIVDSIKTMAEVISAYPSSVIAGAILTVGAITILIGGLLAVIFIFMAQIVNDTKSTNDYKNMAATLILVGTSMLIIVSAIDVLVVGIAALALAFAVVTKIDNSGATIFAAITTVIIITAIIMVAVLALMKEMEKLTPAKIKSIGMMMILVGSAIAIMVGSVVVLIGAIISLILVFTLQMGVSKYLGSESAIAIAIVTVIGIMALIGVFVIVMLKEMEKLTPAKMEKIGPLMLKISEAIIIISAAVLVISLALAIMSKAGVTFAHTGGLALLIGVIMGGIVAFVWAIKKFKTKPDDIIKLSKSILNISAALLVMAAAVAVLSLIEVDKIGWAILGLVGIITVLALAVVGLAYLAKSVPGTQVVIAAFASMLMSLAVVSASIAATIIGFSIAIATLTKCLPKLTDALGPFTVVFVEFLEGIKGHWKELIAVAIAMGVFGAIIASVLIAAVILIVRYRNQIGAALSGLFDKIKDLFKKFADWFKELPTKTKLFISSFVLSISAGLLAATPEMYKQIEAGFMLVMERLGDSVGWITKGLLALVINIINSLADAIRDNAPTLAYAIYSAIEAIIEVVYDLLTPILNATIAPIAAIFTTMSNGISKIAELKKRHGGLFNILNASDEERELAEKEWAEFSSKGIGGLYEEELKKWQSSNLLGSDTVKEMMRGGLAEIADAYGIDPTERLETLSKEFREEANAQIDQSAEDIKDRAKTVAGGVGDSITESITGVGDKLSDWSSSHNIDLSGFISDIKSGDLSDLDILKSFQDENGNFNMSAIADLDSVLNLDNFQHASFQDMATNVQDAGVSLDDLSSSTSDSSSALASLGIQVDGNTEGVGDYTEAVNEATEAQEEFNRSAEDLSDDVNAKKPAFYDAGIELLGSVEEGFNANWSDIAGRITDKFRQLAEDIRSMLEMKDVDLKVGIRSVTPVYSEDVSATPTRDTDAYDSIFNPTASTIQDNYSTKTASSIQAYKDNQKILQSMSPVSSDDISELKDVIRSVKEAVDMQRSSSGDVYLDGNKVGEVMNERVADTALQAVTEHLNTMSRSGNY